MIEYKPLAYTSPSGKRIEFVYDGNIKDGVAHNSSSFKFANLDGKYKQDKSIDFDPYSFIIYLSGDDRVEKLGELRNMLNELGTDNNFGQLEHPDPTLGIFDAVVIKYNVSHSAVRNTENIVVSITWDKTIRNLTDVPGNFSAQTIYSQNLDVFDQLALEFKNAIDIITPGDGAAIASFTASITKVIKTATTIFSTIGSELDEVTIAFNDASAEILSNIDALIAAPEQLALQMQNFLTLPVLLTDNILERVNAFNALITSALSFTVDQLNEINSGNVNGSTYLAVSVLTATSGISGLSQIYSNAKSTSLDDLKRGVSTGFSTRPELQSAISSMQIQVETVSKVISEYSTNYSDIYFFKQFFDNSLLIKPLIKTTITNLQNRLSLLPVGRGGILPFDEHPVLLCALIYGSVDIAVLEFFNQTNEIHGDEMFLLRKGRPLVWFGTNVFESEIAKFTPIIVSPELDVWQDTPWDSGNEQIQDTEWDSGNEQIQDTPVPENLRNL
jgi:hypothetical protein